MLLLTEDMGFKKKPFDKRSKTIWKGKSKTPVIIKSNGRSLKKGYQCGFTIKMFYPLPLVLEICYYKKRRINATRGLCHGNILWGDRATFVTHVFVALTDFILDNLQLGLSISQVMAKHYRNVKQLVETGKNLTTDTFLCE